MTDTVKLIVEIPRERLDSIKRFGIKQNEVSMLERALISGTSLDDVKEEIKSFCIVEKSKNDRGFNEAVLKCFNALNKVGKGE